MPISLEEELERQYLMDLQKSRTRWFSQDERDRLQELNTEKYKDAGGPHDDIALDLDLKNFKPREPFSGHSS